MTGPGDDEDDFVVDDDINPPLDDVWESQFDDDPNPYHGTYSED